MYRKFYFIVVVMTLWCSTAEGAGYPIAGIKPDQRPEGAPVITEVRHQPAWFQHALTGIDRPYPQSLKFLDSQGNWYTPFNRPGMTGRYDIRGWHAMRPKSKQQ